VFTKPIHFLCYEVGRRAGFNACFADGSVRFIRSQADETTLRGLVTRNGGEKVDLSKLE
jgi:prepilin-type processing-associated H-X9-DG protein